MILGALRRKQRPEPPPPTTMVRHLVARSWPSVVYAIGDVHGCFAELAALVGLIEDDAAGITGEKWLVLLGDYVDRGPRSADVLDWLSGPAPAGWRRIALKGNHEAMMLDYRADPSRGGAWLEHGGLETLRSYGAEPADFDGLGARDAQYQFDRHVPADHLSMVANLPLTLSLPGTIFVHASFRPGVALEEQSEHDLLWARPDPGARPARGAPRIIHGHVPAAAAVVTAQRICIDTGAFATGCLTAVRLERDGDPRLIQTAPRGRTDAV